MMTTQSNVKQQSSKSTNTRQLDILKAALHCFINEGVEATTIEMIREKSGASVGSLYHHFGNKEGIAAALYKEGLRQFSLQLQKALKEVSTIEDAIRCIIQANIDWIGTNPDWARFIFRNRRVLKDAKQESTFREEAILTQLTLITRLQALPDFKRLRTLPEPMYLPVLIGPVHEYARQWLDGTAALPFSELEEDFVQIAFKSLLD
ncbi:MAG: TetR/AcrR family transcriptional regulator [Legionellales bacterium]